MTTSSKTNQSHRVFCASALLALCLLSARAVETIKSGPEADEGQRLPMKAENQVPSAPIHPNDGKIISPTSPSVVPAARPARHVYPRASSKSLVDLSHPLENNTLHWPTNTGYQYMIQVEGEKKSQHGESYSVKSDAFAMAVHTGTHLDSPRHFSKDGWTVDKIPLDRLIDVPVTVVDLSEKVKANRSYTFVKDDFLDTKTNEPLVQENSVVLVYTGISESYNSGAKAYFGTESKNISEMKIPGFTKEAATYLVGRGVYGVGLDAPSADSSERHGARNEYDPQAHVVFNENGVYILENISNQLKKLLGAPPARLTMAPLPIVGGSGSPVRLVASIGHDECQACPLKNAAPGESILPGSMSISIVIAVLTFLLVTRSLASFH